MTVGAAPLPAGPVPLTGDELQIVQATGRVGDGLVYAGRDRSIVARLREYAPPGIVRRLPDGTLQPIEPVYADALADGVASFLEQGRRLAGFGHPGITPIWRAEAAEGGGAWLVGAPAGAPLRQTLDEGRVFTPADVVRLAGELADILAMLHGRGLAHLDIAPDTVSIASGHVQLADFAVDTRPFIALLHSHDGLVRPGYSPIEHYDADMAEPLGPPADIHAASALLYRLVTGHDPVPWQQRWRDSDAAPLPDRDDYPPGFLAAVRKGMAIEPGDRFATGAEWRAALNLPCRAVPGVPAPVPAAPERRRRLAVPLLAGTGLLVLALLGVLAWRLGWPAPAPTADTGNVQVPSGGNSRQPPGPVAIPIRTGDTVTGHLAEDDPTGPDGGYRDAYLLDGHRGDRIEIRVRAAGFTPVIGLFGPGLPGQQGENGRLVVTLPRNGDYTLLVWAGRAGATGDYSLAVVSAPDEGGETGPIDPAAARRLAGVWHDEDDDICKIPAVNSVQAGSLIVRLGPDTYRHRIDSADGDEIDTTIIDGPLVGRTFHFRLAPDGRSYDMDGETWTQC